MSLDTCRNKSTYYFILVAQNILGSTWQEFGRGEFLVPEMSALFWFFLSKKNDLVSMWI